MALLPTLSIPDLPFRSLIPAPSNGENRLFTDGSFKGYVFHVTKPTRQKPHGVNNLIKVVEARVQIINRPGQTGSDVNTFGFNGRPLTAEIEFHGPNYLSECASFLAVCTDGQAGKLILPDEPKAILATFQRAEIRSSAQDGECFIVTALWVETIAPPATAASVSGTHPGSVASAVGTIASIAASIASAAASVQQSVASAGSSITSNGFVSGVSSIYGGLSTARSTIVSVLKTSTEARAQILQAVGQINATLNQATAITNRVLAMITRSSSSSGSSSSTSSPITASPIATTIDPVTGQQVADYSEPDSMPVATNPLAPPPAVPVITLPVPPVRTNAGASLAVQSVASSLIALGENLSDLSGGHTDDITQSLKVVRNNLLSLALIVAAPPTRQVMTEVELSLHEVLFANGISVDQCQVVYRNNPQIEDILAIPAGTVINL